MNRLLQLAALLCLHAPLLTAQPAPEDAALVQASAVLTVAESKRLIAKAVVALPVVRQALATGMIIVARGTTNTYVAEELLGETIAPGAFVTGRIYPAKGGSILPKMTVQSEIVLVDGQRVDGLSLEDAVKRLKPGDVVIKGANAVDREAGQAGVLIGAPNGGTTGALLPYVVARKAHLIIPVGLEKQVAGRLSQVAERMREPIEDLTRTPSMFLITGTIVTEIEALEALTGVTAFQAAAGGIGGAEGSVWLVFRGARPAVQKALALMTSIQGEPPFVK